LKRSLFLASAALIAAPCSAIGDWTAPVEVLQSTYIGSDCIYFTLHGVSVADPALPSTGAWFAMPRTQNGSRDAYAMLLTAKVSGLPVRVSTTGAIACGYPQVASIYMP
jgi:hypothetical protein